jgi:exodeoxyribonuclease V alpha subunit
MVKDQNLNTANNNLSCAKYFPLPLTAKLSRIVFRKEDFYILSFETIDEIPIELTAKGNLSLDPIVGLTYEIHGTWLLDKNYGEQVAFDYINIQHGDSALEFLASGFIKGIKEGIAKKIVKAFGDKTFDILDNFPEELYKVKGIGKKKVAEILENYAKTKVMQDLIIELKGNGFSLNQISKIYRILGSSAIKIIKQNPYAIIPLVEGIGFSKVDEYALKIGIKKNDRNRILAGFEQKLKDASYRGHTYLPENEFLLESEKLLEIKRSQLSEHLYEKSNHIRIRVIDNKRVALRIYYNAEQNIANQIDRLMLKGETLPYELEITNKEDKIIYSGEQLMAVRKVFENPISIITGFPGVGKTMVIKKIMETAQKANYSLSMASPTGKAAIRMEEVTGHEAKTLHRLLGIKFDEEKLDEVVELSGFDILIIDETSMLDVVLASRLLSSVPNKVHLVFVGDPNQLPSVGAGNFLNDLINYNKIPCTRLNFIYRTGAGSTISKNANRILNNETLKTSSDFLYLNIGEEKKQLEAIKEISKKLNPKKSQILSPMKKGLVGVINLNQELQPILNKNFGNEGIDLKVRKFYVGDKIMQYVNDYEKGVFNGEIGIVEGLTENNELKIDFGEKNAYYARQELEEIELAYVTTVHKFQGSECDTVVIVLNSNQKPLLQRKLFYTAITRARKRVILIAAQDTLRMAVSNTREPKRYTLLEEFLNRED